MSSPVGDCLDALYAAALDLYGDQKTSDGELILVSYGPPSNYQPNGIIAVGFDVRSQISRPTMGTSRSREQAVDIDTVISIYEPGGDEAQQPANQRACELLNLLEGYFRTRGLENLNGTCREAWVSAAPLKPSVAYDQSDPNLPPVPTGRVAEITATVTALIRY